MALRNGHGNGAGVPRVEVLPVDELPAGVPSSADDESRAAAVESGPFRPGNKRSVLGGRATAGKTRLATRLGLGRLADDADFRPYKAAASSFRRAQCSRIAAEVGGGVCGPAPSSMVASAALQLAWSRYLSDRAAVEGDATLVTQASRLADASRQNLLAAHELAAREAAARPRETDFDRVRRALMAPAAPETEK